MKRSGVLGPMDNERARSVADPGNSLRAESKTGRQFQSENQLSDSLLHALSLTYEFTPGSRINFPTPFRLKFQPYFSGTGLFSITAFHSASFRFSLRFVYTRI